MTNGNYGNGRGRSQNGNTGDRDRGNERDQGRGDDRDRGRGDDRSSEGRGRGRSSDSRGRGRGRGGDSRDRDSRDRDSRDRDNRDRDNRGGGRGRGGPRRDNRGGDNRGRGRGGRGRDNRGGGGNRGRGRSRHGGGRNPRQMAASGNKRERIAVESGSLVLIDQFMLANPQFAEKLLDLLDEAPEKKDELVRDYGGTVVELTPGTYRIDRDPFAFQIIIHPDGDRPQREDVEERFDAGDNDRVLVDTRCLAMVDRELLDDSGLLEKYQQLWFSGQEKTCRDLLRDNGGAVRYGFQRFGDELDVCCLEDDNVVCLRPHGHVPVAKGTSEESSEEPAAEAAAAE